MHVFHEYSFKADGSLIKLDYSAFDPKTAIGVSFKEQQQSKMQKQLLCGIQMKIPTNKEDPMTQLTHPHVADALIRPES